MKPYALAQFSEEHFINQQALRPLLFGHRGYSSRAPENTMSAFRLCADLHIPGIELDVHLTEDGKIVVIHDHNLKRTAGIEAVVEACRLDDLRRADIGSWFSPEFTGELIITLQELFETFSDRFYYDIELKDETRGDSGLASAVVDVIEKSGLEMRCILSSFNPFPLIAARKRSKSIPTAIIYSNDKAVPAILRRGFGKVIASTPILKPDFHQAGPFATAWYRRVEGRAVIPWTVDDLASGKMLLHRGVDGLITNDPEIQLKNFGVEKVF